MDDAEYDQWREKLAEADERLGEVDDSTPQDQVIELLSQKIAALRYLDRHEEAIAACEQLIQMCATDPKQTTQRRVLRAMLVKAAAETEDGRGTEAIETVDTLLAFSRGLEMTERVSRWVMTALLVKLGALGDAASGAPGAAVDEELVRRFGDAEQPVIHEQVTTALTRIGARHLRAGATDDVIRTSTALAGRIRTAPEESLGSEIDAVLHYVQVLIAWGRGGWRGLTEFVVFGAVNITARGTDIAGAKLQELGVVGALTGRARTNEVTASRTGGSGSATPGRGEWPRWSRARLRMRAAINLHESIMIRIGDDPEFRHEKSISRFRSGQAHLLLGDLRTGMQQIDPFVAGSSTPAPDADVAQVLHSEAGDLRDRTDLPGQLAAVATLAWRAYALGQGDAAIEKIAYEDSVAPIVSATRFRAVRWLAALLTPEPRSPEPRGSQLPDPSTHGRETPGSVPQDQEPRE